MTCRAGTGVRSAIVLFIAMIAVAPAQGDETGTSHSEDLGDALGQMLEEPSEPAEVVLTSSCAQGACCSKCGDCGCDSCASCCKKKAKPNPCATSHKPLFYTNDFSYLDQRSYNGNCLGDRLKRNALGQCGRWGMLDIGGQIRMRYHHEEGMGQDIAGAGTRRFEDTEHDFELSRVRLYSDWRANDWLRIYTEGIVSHAIYDRSEYKPRAIDRNFGDFLNVFADLKLTDQATVRIGRQELLYGAQRLVSPLDWANTRRTFEGAKLLLKGGAWDVDLFYTHFVPVVPNDLDEADYDQPFYGCWTTYRGWEDTTLEMFYLGYDNQNPSGPVIATGDFSLHTVGARLHGTVNSWLFDLQGGPQFGRQSGLGVDHSATFATGGMGHAVGKESWKMTLWCYYDYASGNAGGGDFNRFNQLFPLAHKYLGFIDAVQRSNVEAPNALLTFSPSKKVKVLMWYWHFMANQAGDIVPSIGGTPTQSLSSKDLGDELDLILSYRIGPRSNVLLGYSHFWRGNKITAPNDADFIYGEWGVNF